MYFLLKSVRNNPDVIKAIDELYRIPFDKYHHRIPQIVRIISLLNSNPNAQKQFEEILETTREEQEEQASRH
ncbi:MAG: hypothetical protein QNK11_05160 [Legionella sp.]|nr:hypothetical protein [Legionella sp.]